MPSNRISVLIVDDSAFSRQTIRKMLETGSAIEVVAVATDGIDAMAKSLRYKPDIITLDFEMPEMDGFSFLRWVMKERPTPVIMVSSYGDSSTVFKALELGAVDFIAKPTKRASLELKNIEHDLLAKVNNIEKHSLRKLQDNLELLAEAKTISSDIPAQHVAADIIAIGSSTGGPAALQIILTRLPAQFPSILISQHMPSGFTKPLAERLNRLTSIAVKEAEDNERIVPSTAYICPGGVHLEVKKKNGAYYTNLRVPSQSDRYVPSVDIMMRSVSDCFGSKSIGVLLTGMGDDGKKGMLEIKSRGGYTIAESEETAVVFGMPKEAIKAGAASSIKPLSDIPNELVKILKKG
ncbi:MAG: protein-glutamate methylesterase/protein-glutamine glutaminase [bacterium]